MDADDHEGLAPAFVLLAECDPLVDDGLAYADKLRAAGNAVELELVRGVTHDFIKARPCAARGHHRPGRLRGGLAATLAGMKRSDFRFVEALACALGRGRCPGHRLQCPLPELRGHRHERLLACAGAALCTDHAAARGRPLCAPRGAGLPGAGAQ